MSVLNWGRSQEHKNPNLCCTPCDQKKGTRSPPCGFWTFQKFHLSSSHSFIVPPASSQREWATFLPASVKYLCLSRPG